MLRPAESATATAAPSGSRRNLAVSPDGSEIVIGGPQGAVSVWDTDNGELKRTLVTGRPGGAVTAVSVGRDGSITAGAGRRLYRWPATGEPREVGLQDPPDDIEVSAFSPDGRWFAAFGDRPPVAVWDAATGERQLELDESVWADLLEFSPDGRWLAVARMGRLWLFDVADSEPLWKQRPEGTVRHLRFAASDARLEALVDYDGLLDFELDPDTGALRAADPFAPRRTVRHSRGGGADRKLVTVSPDGTLVAERDGGAAIRVWELTTTRDVLVIEDAPPAVAAVFLTGSRRLVTAAADGSGIVWDLASWDFAADPPAAEPLSSDAAAALWRKLGDDNGEAAWQALVALVHRPDKALRLIESPPSLDGLAIRLISQLDNPDATLRSLATRRLADMSVAIEALLRDGLESDPSAEAAARLRRLLRRLAGPDKQKELQRLARSRRFRGLRTIRLLEWIGTVEARRALQRLRREWNQRSGSESEELVTEADRALRRWFKFSGNGDTTREVR